VHRHRAHTTIDAKEIAMIPYAIDPSLHPAEPPPQSLGDGFSPPPPDTAHEADPMHAHVPGAALGDKSDF
jgi:hypothetical protein